MIQNYTQIIERISKSCGKPVEEIDRLVEAKRAKLSGLISREGAAQIIAAELGISFEKEKSKLGELIPGMKKINVVGKIIRLFQVKEYKKDTREGKIGSFILADDSSNIRVVLWDTNHISLLESGQIKEGDVVELRNANLRNTELHLTGFSDIKKSLEVLENVKETRMTVPKKISELTNGDNFNTRAVIVQIFNPRFFEVCPECNKKLVSDGESGLMCEVHGKTSGKKKAILSIILDDGFGNIRSVLFSEQVERLGFSEEDLKEENFPKKREKIIGEEYLFSGNARQNKLFNNLEVIISDIKKLDIEELILELEK